VSSARALERSDNEFAMSKLTGQKSAAGPNRKVTHVISISVLQASWNDDRPDVTDPFGVIATLGR